MDKKIFMLCESVREDEVDKNFSNKEEYLAQEKKDGERVIAFIENHKVILFNRRGNIINLKFPEIVEALKDIDNCIIDGEICAKDEKFNSIQKRNLKDTYKIQKAITEIPVIYWIFDVLRIGEDDYRNIPLKERIICLYESLFDGVSKDYSFEKVKILEWYSIDEALKIAHDKKGEGIVIKDLRGKYESRRSKNWIKCKFFEEISVILTTYTPNNAGIRCEDKNGIVAVQVSGEQHREVKDKIDKNGSCECYIQYLTKSDDGKLRFPSFRGVV